jgi:hypothetical protein
MRALFTRPSCFVWVLALSVSGCATLFAPGPDHVPVDSTPSGAHVLVDSQEVGLTPTTVTLDRKTGRGIITVEAPGYMPSITQRDKAFNSIALLNFLGLVPWVVDLATGNHERFDTTPVRVSLVPRDEQSSSAAADEEQPTLPDYPGKRPAVRRPGPDYPREPVPAAGEPPPEP